MEQGIKVFISYAQKDGPLLEELNKHLALLKWQNIIDVWYDREINAGMEWERQIDTHLNTAQIVLLLVSPDFMASQYCYSVEMARAMKRHEAGNARVIPVILRPVDWQRAPFGGLQALPTAGKAVTEWSNQDSAFLDIVRGIRNAVEGLLGSPSAGRSSSASPIRGYLPPPPALVIGREVDISELKTRLGITPGGLKRKLMIIRGWPGVGKSTLVSTLAYDPDIARAYPDGVLWTSLGEYAGSLSKLAAWVRALGVPNIPLSSLEEVMEQLRALLQNKQMLLLVDDVYKDEDASPFKNVAGPECAMLITTRFRDIAHTLAMTPDDIYLLGVLSNEKALELLARVAPTVVSQYPGKSRTLVGDLEGLPLAIRVAGHLLESEIRLGVDISGMLDELRASRRLLDERAPDDRFDPNTGTTPTINLLLKQSTDHLDEQTRERFAYLGAFAPKPATFNLEAMKAVWEVDDAMPTVRLLADHGLLEPMINQEIRFQMHALLVMHAQSLLRDEE